MLPYLIIPAFLALVLLVPVSADISYDADGLRVYLRLWKKLIQLFPKKKQDNSLSGKNKEKQKLSFYDWQDIIKPVLKVLKNLKLSKFKLYYISAGPDPYKAVRNYSMACAALSSVYPFIDAKDRDVVLRTDFEQEKSTLFFYISITVIMLKLLLVSLTAGKDIIRIFIKRKVSHGKQTQRYDADYNV